MEEFNHFCDGWNQMKPNICNESFSPQDDNYSIKELYDNRNPVSIIISKESDKSESGTRIIRKIKNQNNKTAQTKRTRTNAEERKLVMTVYKNLLAGRCVETFGSGSVKRTSELTGLPLRSVYRIRNEELIACGSIEFDNTAAHEHDSDVAVTQATKTKPTRQKRLSLTKKRIIFHVFDTLRSEQPDSSDSAVINITSEVTGCPVRTIHRIRVEEKSEQGLQGPKVAKAKDAKKYKLSFKKYGDDVRLAIRRTIYEVQAATEFPIIKEIHDAVNERLNLALSRSTLMRLIKHLGFFFVRKEGKKHILVEKSRDATKKPRKPKAKTNCLDASLASNGRSCNGPLSLPGGFGDMFASVPSEYAFLGVHKSYEAPPPPPPSHTCTHTAPPAGAKPKRVLAKLDGEEVRTAIRTVIRDLKVSAATPTISDIQQNVKGRFNMSLARTTLHRHIKRAGFVFKKKEGNKHVLVEKPLKKLRKARKGTGAKGPSILEAANEPRPRKRVAEQRRAECAPTSAGGAFDSIAYDVAQYVLPFDDAPHALQRPLSAPKHCAPPWPTN